MVSGHVTNKKRYFVNCSNKWIRQRIGFNVDLNLKYTLQQLLLLNIEMFVLKRPLKKPTETEEKKLNNVQLNVNATQYTTRQDIRKHNFKEALHLFRTFILNFVFFFSYLLLG